VPQPDLLVVGGGIFGCATAWYAAQRGARVTLIERHAIGSQTTSRAAALLTRVHTKPCQSALVVETRRAIEALGEELGQALDLRRVGSLQLAASEASAADLDPFEFLDRAAVSEHLPWLDSELIVRAAFMREDAHLDPYLLASAYAGAAKARGAVLSLGTNVTGLLRDGERVLGVETESGPVEASSVALCAGPWTGLLAADAGWHLPMAPVRSHYWITDSDPALFPSDQPFVVLPDAHAYARTEVGSLLFGLRDRASLSRDPRTLPDDLARLNFEEDPQGREVLLEQGPAFARFFPGLETIGLAHYVAGPSTYTPDGQYVIGKLPGAPGAVVATGCCGAGIATSGGVGRALADLALEGTSDLDLGPFAPDRFGVIDAFDADWQRRCAASRSAKTSG
jgi:sarcosine oxidase subunit beta